MDDAETLDFVPSCLRWADAGQRVSARFEPATLIATWETLV